MSEYKIDLNDEELNKVTDALRLMSIDKKLNLINKGIDIQSPFVNGQDYYYIDDIGGIIEATWRDSISDFKRLEIGNCFADRDSISNKIRYLKIKNKINQFAEPFDSNWDFDNEDGHWCMTVSVDDDTEEFRLDVEEQNYYKTDCTYFKSEEKLDKCIEFVGKEDILFYLGES